MFRIQIPTVYTRAGFPSRANVHWAYEFQVSLSPTRIKREPRSDRHETDFVDDDDVDYSIDDVADFCDDNFQVERHVPEPKNTFMARVSGPRNREMRSGKKFRRGDDSGKTILILYSRDRNNRLAKHSNGLLNSWMVCFSSHDLNNTLKVHCLNGIFHSNNEVLVYCWTKCPVTEWSECNHAT